MLYYNNNLKNVSHEHHHDSRLSPKAMLLTVGKSSIYCWKFMPTPIPNVGKSVPHCGAQKMELWCESASVMLTIFIIQSLSAHFFLFGAHFHLAGGARTSSNISSHFANRHANIEHWVKYIAILCIRISSEYRFSSKKYARMSRIRRKAVKDKKGEKTDMRPWSFGILMLGCSDIDFTNAPEPLLSIRNTFRCCADRPAILAWMWFWNQTESKSCGCLIRKAT